MKVRRVTWRRTLAVLALVVIGWLAWPRVPQVPPFQMHVYDGKFIVTGAIQTGSAERLRTMINWYPDIRTLVLLSVPGSIDLDNTFEMGRLVREAGLTTVVPAHGLIASGGTDLFLAGARRRVERGACIGVHSWEDSLLFFAPLLSYEGQDADPDDPYHARFLGYLREMGIPNAFYWFTLKAASHDSMHWLSGAEIKRFRVATSVAAALRQPDDDDCQNRYW
ncbi:MAG: alpha/beta hydrolase [Hyphomicrobiaceae bacterium]